LKIVSIKTPQDYIAEIIGPELHDGCNLSEDENDEHTCENNSLKASNSSMKIIKISEIFKVDILWIYTYIDNAYLDMFRSILSSKSNGNSL